MKKSLPIGISDFKEIIEGNYAYIDKSLLIQELVESGSKVSLIPRMRRFGKTLNLSMLSYFFEKTKESNSRLFTSLNIWKSEKYRAMQGQFPVIFLTFKDIKRQSWEATLQAFQDLIATEFERHRYLLEGSTLSPEEKENYFAILQKNEDILLETSLWKLTHWLHRYHNRRVILLIDEYDAPAHAGFVNGYYETLVSFLRNLLSAVLKDNSFLQLGVLTGILRVAKESIFSGLNNVSIFSVLNEHFQDKFGLLEEEVTALLTEYDLLEVLPEMRTWYDGYRVGAVSGIYNPWSVLKCIGEKGKLTSYWANTSDNALMASLITESVDQLKTDLEDLLEGKTISKTIQEGIVFSDLKRNSQTIWSLLLFSGYLTVASTQDSDDRCDLKIPNAEVRKVYQSMVSSWFERSITEDNYHLLLKSLTLGDIETFSAIFAEFVRSTLSLFDVADSQPERVYHAFVLGMLIGLKGSYEVKSNRESGFGRYDVTLFPKNPNDLGIVIEFKKIHLTDTFDLEGAANAALKQIETKQYVQELLDRGIKRHLLLGIAFEGKKVLIRSKST